MRQILAALSVTRSVLPARTVLVIDDDVRSRDRLADALRGDGWTVLDAGDATTACRLLDEVKEPHAIVLEPNLAGTSWYHLLRRAARAVRSTRLIVATAYWSFALAEESKSAGAELCLRKPVDADGIRKLLRTGCPDPQPEPIPERTSLAFVEWEYVNKVVRDCGGNMSQAARLLGIHRPSLYKKLRKHPPSR